MHPRRDFVLPTGAQLLGETFARSIVEPEEPGQGVVDLRGASWVEPGGLVAVAALVDEQLSLGRDMYVLGPVNGNVASYLSRMRLGRLLDEMGADHDLAPVNEHAVERSLLELTRFTGEDGVDALAEIPFDTLEADHPVVASALYEAICEIGCNVPQHSGKSHGFMAAQTTWHGQEIRFAVADSGVGIAATLADVGIHAEATALDSVLNEGISRTGDPARGRGIPRTRELLTGLGGNLFLASGAVQRTAFSHAVRGRPLTQPVPGTVLQGTILRR